MKSTVSCVIIHKYNFLHTKNSFMLYIYSNENNSAKMWCYWSVFIYKQRGQCNIIYQIYNMLTLPAVVKIIIQKCWGGGFHWWMMRQPDFYQAKSTFPNFVLVWLWKLVPSLAVRWMVQSLVLLSLWSITFTVPNINSYIKTGWTSLHSLPKWLLNHTWCTR